MPPNDINLSEPMWTIPLPISVSVGKDKRFSLNLNEYRNSHYFILNKAKVVFKERVAPLLKHVPKLERCTLEFKLYMGSKHLSDVSNICCIVEKFFNDTFVELNKIEDDNYTMIPESRYNFGGIDKSNPRVEVTITPIGDPVSNIPKEETMQITLVQAEIEQAITDYVQKVMTVADGMQISIDLKATRGAEGMQAFIDIVPKGTVVATPAPVTAKSVAKDVVAKAKETAVEPVKATAAPKATPAPAPAPEADPEPQDTPAEVDPEPEQETVTDEPTATAEEAAPAAPRKSLFAGLGKPVNA